MKKFYKLKLTVGALLAGFTSIGQVEATFEYTGGLQTYTVPPGTTNIQINAQGAQGGNDGGLGAIMQGNFNVTPGEVLTILVGGEGQMATNTRVGGGGGTFVVDGDGNPLIVAGGGGGKAWDGTGAPTFPGIDANTMTNGNNGYSEENGLGGTYLFRHGVGGVDGNGSTIEGADGLPHAGNGGGFFTSGADGQCGLGGQGFELGGLGGTGCSGGAGGFGGGGNGGNSGGGGGGGYSGGGGSYHSPTNGGGGGSFNDGTAQLNSVGRTGDGLVTFSIACDGLVTTITGTELCSADSLTLFAESDNGGTITWDMGVENGVAFQPNMVGTFTFTAVSDNADDCSCAVDILFTESPEYELTTTDELIGGDGGVDLTLISGIFPFQYDWSDDGTGDFDDTQNLPAAGAGMYSVTVAHGNGCTRTRLATVNSQLSVNENVVTALSVYPNPAKDNVSIAYNGTFTFILTNALGEIVLNGTAVNQTMIDLTILPRGNYFVTVQSESGTATKKITAL